jgi:hypothetical protein
MPELRKGRTEAARLTGLGKHLRYPVARMDLEYRLVSNDGQQGQEVHTLKLIVSCDEAAHFQDLRMRWQNRAAHRTSPAPHLGVLVTGFGDASETAT